MLTKEDIKFLAHAVVSATKSFNPETTSHGSGFYQRSSKVLIELERMLEEEEKKVTPCE